MLRDDHQHVNPVDVTQQLENLKIQDDVSEIRQIVQDDGFGQILEDVEMQSIHGLDQIDFQSPQKLDGIKFDGFDLEFEAQPEKVPNRQKLSVL